MTGVLFARRGIFDKLASYSEIVEGIVECCHGVHDKGKAIVGFFSQGSMHCHWRQAGVTPNEMGINVSKLSSMHRDTYCQSK